MIEQWASIAAAAVVFFAAVLRLNMLHATRRTIDAWRVIEVIGLSGLMGGCAGSIGEWFLENAEFHAETIVMTSMAALAIAISRGELRELFSRLKIWDGSERRLPHLTADEFLEHRFQRRL